MNMSSKTRIKSLLVDLLAEEGAEPDHIRAVFAAAAAHADVEMMSLIADHPGLNMEADERRMFQDLVQICGMVKQVSDRLQHQDISAEQLDEEVSALADQINARLNPDAVSEAEQATQAFLRRMQLQ
jgi:hypothetical protein